MTRQDLGRHQTDQGDRFPVAGPRKRADSATCSLSSQDRGEVAQEEDEDLPQWDRDPHRTWETALCHLRGDRLPSLGGHQGEDCLAYLDRQRRPGDLGEVEVEVVHLHSNSSSSPIQEP